MWGGASGRLRFPFSRPFNYGGTSDLCLDFAFSGGRLTEAGARFDDQFHLDAPFAPHENYGPRDPHSVPPSPGGCKESYTSAPATSLLTIVTHGLAHPNWPNTFLLDLHSFRTKRSAPLLFALSAYGVRGGIAFPGIACQRLFVDLSQPSRAPLGDHGPLRIGVLAGPRAVPSERGGHTDLAPGGVGRQRRRRHPPHRRLLDRGHGPAEAAQANDDVRSAADGDHRIPAAEQPEQPNPDPAPASLVDSRPRRVVRFATKRGSPTPSSRSEAALLSTLIASSRRLVVSTEMPPRTPSESQTVPKLPGCGTSVVRSWVHASRLPVFSSR